MYKKIFRSICFITLLVFFLNLALMTGALYQYFEKRMEAELQSEGQYIARALETEGDPYLQGLYTGEKRLTLIAADGRVLYDTDARVETLENHADREEVQEALSSGSGSSSRYSNTLTVKTLYYAVRLSDGNILRISVTQYTIAALLIGLLRPICIIVLVAVILASVLASRVSKSIVGPINQLDLEHPEDVQTYEELGPLLSRIARQKREIERQLTQAQKRQEEFRLITENMSEGFLVIDGATKLLTYNTAALQLLDVTGNVGSSVLDLNRTADFRDAVQTALEGAHAECEMPHAGKLYQLIANPVWEEETVIGAVLVLLDVTEKSQREALRREFSSNVSHELKTPLTSISGFAELMKGGGVAESEVQDFSQSIYDEAQRLICLVSDIIKLTQLEDKADLYETEQVDLYDLAAEELGRLRHEAAAQNVTLSLLGDSAPLYGVRQILSELLHNLCDNAIKYNREGGRVDVLITRSEYDIKLMVRDTGIGIPASQQDRVFERFYRVDQSHSKKIGGTGLGLSIVKHSASYHNATVQLESTVDVGTTVTVTFPSPAETQV